jgi:hypothetical protein
MEVKLWGTDLPKPLLGDACNGCGFCCATEPCGIAKEYLQCTEGPCVALETSTGRAVCGMIRNPLMYLFRATHPNAEVDVLAEAPDLQEGMDLSASISAALGVGLGCDAEDP